MFDNTQHTTLNVTPEAATSLPPVRVVLGNDVYWLRPSNVLRVEATAYAHGRPRYLNIVLSDGATLSSLCTDMQPEAFHQLADSIVSTLWPSTQER